MAQIMTTKEAAKYLGVHEITICKYAAQGEIPAVRIGRVWRFDKNAIDEWLGGDQTKAEDYEDAQGASILMKSKR
jgi:excisionase family DNA binding protein